MRPSPAPAYPPVMERTVLTVQRTASRATLAFLSIGLLAIGCGLSGSNPASSPGPSPATSASPASITPRSSGVPSASAALTPSPQPSAGPAGPPSLAEPPAASLGVEGGDAVAGQLGSFTWQNGGSDSPWLDGSPIHVGPGERLTLTLPAEVGVANWTAGRVAPGNRDGSGAVGMGEGSSGPVAFDAPPRGAWSVNVNVWFSDNRGSAAYYWLVSVD